MIAGVLPFFQLATAGDAWAHAFGARYDLPLPLDIYLAGAGLVILLTFGVSVLFLAPGRKLFGVARIDIPMAKPSLAVASEWVRWSGVLLGLCILALILAAAFIGNESPTKNFAPTFVWVIWWVGLVYLAALVTDLWPWLSPWRSIALALDRWLGDRRRRLSYPQKLGHWPAVILFFAFAWIELVFEAGEQPRTLGTLILAYSSLTILGALLFGAERWLSHGEIFALVFGVFGRFAPLRFDRKQLRLRFFGAGLLVERGAPRALMVFIILMLSTVTFDGFIETPAWSGFLDWIVADMTLRPALLALRGAGIDLLMAIKTGALLAFPLVFLGVYLFFCRLIAWMAGSPLSALKIGGAFVYSLVPIAIAYHLAHYYSFLLLAGQLIIPLISDPFGFGWNLFGTANHAMDITVVNAKTTWYVAVVAIVLGHAFAVLIGHVTALRLFAGGRSAALSQIPMTVLMIAYTMISLWILSQPIVEAPSL